MSDISDNTLNAHQTLGLLRGPYTYSAVLYRAPFDTHYSDGDIKESFSSRQEFVFASTIEDFTEKLIHAHLSFVPDIIDFGCDGMVDETFLLVNGILIESLPGSAADLYEKMDNALSQAEQAARDDRSERDRIEAQKANEARLARERLEKEEQYYKDRQEYARLGRKLGIK